jgi:CRP/FNR family transcriptional regulator
MFLTHVKLEGDEILFYEAEAPKYLHLLACGIVKLYKYDARENEVVIHHLQAPKFIAEIVNFEKSTFPANCMGGGE